MPDLVSSTPEVQSDPMVAFGGFVKPEMYDIFGEHDFNSLTDQEKQWIFPRRMARLLLNPPVGTDMSVRYSANTSTNDVELALNPLEFNLLARYPQALGRSSISGVLKDNDLSDDILAASQRARGHVFEKKKLAMDNHVAKLVERRQDIKLLQKRIKHAGYAHERKSSMVQLISGAWQEGITMLDVLHVQRSWDDAKRHKAEAALAFYLTSGSQNTRIAHWREFTGLADSYLGARIAVFKNRIKIVGQG